MYPLPLAPQECYTKWFRFKINKGQLKKYEIVWVGQQLKTRFRFDSNNVAAENIFICRYNNNFEYILIDKNDEIFKLPKKYYTCCFPGIQYNNVPKNNRMKVQITENIEMDLPYIPQAFLESKKTKTRKRRRIVSAKNESSQHMLFNQNFPSWHVLQNSQNTTTVKKELMLLVRSMVKYADKNKNFSLNNPFEAIDTINDIKNNKELLRTLNIICGFVFHYCRSELGIIDDNILYSTEWIAKLNSVE